MKHPTTHPRRTQQNKTFVLLFALTFFFSVSCNKQDNSITNNLVATSNSIPNHKNPANPYEEIGELHNEICIHLLRVNNDTTLDISSMIHEIDSFLKENYDANIDFTDSFNNSSVLQVLNLQALSNLTSLAASKQYLDSIPSVQGDTLVTNYLTQMLDILFGDSNNVITYYQSIIAIEGNIQLDTSLSRDEKKQLLVFATVLRHSSYLWKEAAPQITTQTKAWSWNRFGAADCMGALQAWGFLGGGPGGAAIFGGYVAFASTAAALIDH